MAQKLDADMKVAVQIIRELKRKHNVPVDETFLALLACVYPKGWDWANAALTYIVKSEPISDKNIRFSTGEKVTIDVIKQAVHSLNIARRRVGKQKVLGKYAGRYRRERGLPHFTRRAGTYPMHTK